MICFLYDYRFLKWIFKLSVMSWRDWLCNELKFKYNAMYLPVLVIVPATKQVSVIYPCLNLALVKFDWTYTFKQLQANFPFCCVQGL